MNGVLPLVKRTAFFALAAFLVVSSNLTAGEISEAERCATYIPSEAEVLAQQLQISDWLAQYPVQSPEAITTIPVAFHILRSSSGQYDVTDQQIDDQIDVLNGAFSNTNFQFSHFSTDRTNNSTWSTGGDELGFKSTLAVDPENTLNFYTGNLGGGLLGWAVFPWQYPEDSFWHGVVVHYASLPGGTFFPYNEGDTGTHEVGHYLGLYHTFQGGCTGGGDLVDDTNAEATPAFGCPVRDTCPADPGLDPVENFMDYSDDDCMYLFTQGQSDRMDLIVDIYKPGLLDGGTGGNDIPCEDVSSFQARCNGAGSVQMRIFMTDNSHVGETVEFTIDGNDSHEVTIIEAGIRVKAQLSLPNYGAGPHTVELTDPAGCFDPVDVVCFSSASIELDDELWLEGGAEVSAEVPLTATLAGNYPNPFNPSTTIEYGIPADGIVSLKVYNTLGQEVATLVDGFRKAGYHSAVWSGRNLSGQTVSSGIYIYRLVAGNVVMSQKMILSK